MRNLRRLPLLLRAASLLALLFAIAAIAAFLSVLTPAVFTLPPSLSPSPVDANRTMIIAANLGMLAAACSLVVNGYSLRFRQAVSNGPFPLDSWQSQLRRLALLAALPLSALVLAIQLPRTSFLNLLLAPPSLLGILPLLAAAIYVMDRWYALNSVR